MGKPQFYYIKVGCKWVFITRTCFRDGFCRPSAIEDETHYLISRDFYSDLRYDLFKNAADFK